MIKIIEGSVEFLCYIGFSLSCVCLFFSPIFVVIALNAESLHCDKSLVRITSTGHCLISQWTLIELKRLESILESRRFRRSDFIILSVMQCACWHKVFIFKGFEVELTAENVTCDKANTIILEVKACLVCNLQAHD